MPRSLKRSIIESMWVALPLCGVIWASTGAADPNTTELDFFVPGSQALEHIDSFETSQVCSFCHGGFQATLEPYRPWNASMMGQASRDPVMLAARAIANQDVPGSGASCVRCHSPIGAMNGHGAADGSQLADYDLEGVSCSICHRMVNPTYVAGESPAVDLDILTNLANPPVSAHNAAFVLDPYDRRRAPFTLLPQATYHEWLQSPFHQKSNMCATCHDVSNPAFSKQPNGTYALNAVNTPHPTQNKFDMFPEQRTYSEWSRSAFALAPIEMGGRFGGNKTAVSSCQDCHMADASGTACQPFLGGAQRNDLPQHHFNGGNNWVLRAINKMNDPGDTGLTDDAIDASIARAETMLASASDLEVRIEDGGLKSRVINTTGHKLPTGYPEGRRIWVNVQFFDAQGTLVGERGAYDPDTATLTEGDTKVYEAHIGMDATIAAISGKPAGVGFHLALNNTFFKDNRIPPMGFTNAGFAAVQASPVGATYADGQNWDDTLYTIPNGAVTSTVRVYYQNASRVYMEFLRDNNFTDDAGTRLWNEYQRFNQSPPVLMDEMTVAICPGDFNHDGAADFFDYDDFVVAFEAGLPTADFDADGTIDFFDYDAFVVAFETPC